MVMVFAHQFTSLFNDVVENTSYNDTIQLLSNTDNGTNVIRILVESVPTIIAFIYRKK